ncbi:hypothetical protein PR048_011705 [Dryococelus australis]|uniref:YqaJ viral recombinase domain-containing protein n=1 Tax=Dryococelus australis TaxID=614101 RepID=A0ABQ9HME7_9NEOP|nr:hypothetical protein PR048_011705 [Dryococelus australis]
MDGVGIGAHDVYVASTPASHQSDPGCAVTKYGIAKEPFAIAQLHKQLEKETEPAGLYADPNLPWFAATPDALVDNDALVEVKCPVTARNLTPQEAVKENKLTFCVLKDDHLYLKENNPYFIFRNANTAILYYGPRREYPAGETGESRENPQASGIVRHDSHNVKIRERPCRVLNPVFLEASDNLFSYLSFSSSEGECKIMGIAKDKM